MAKNGRAEVRVGVRKGMDIPHTSNEEGLKKGFEPDGYGQSLKVPLCDITNISGDDSFVYLECETISPRDGPGAWEAYRRRATIDLNKEAVMAILKLALDEGMIKVKPIKFE